MARAVIAFTVLFVLMAVGRILWQRRPAPRLRVPVSGGILVLRPPRRNGVMLGITALIPAGVFGALASRAWLTGRTGPAGLVAVSAVTLAAFALSAYEFASAFRQRILVHVAGLERVGVLRRRRLRWGEIASVAYNPLHSWFFVKASDGTRFWLSEDLSGIGDFAEIALRRLPSSAFQGDPQAREVLEDLAASARAEAASGQ